MSKIEEEHYSCKELKLASHVLLFRRFSNNPEKKEEKWPIHAFDKLKASKCLVFYSGYVTKIIWSTNKL